jgi:serine phosphatase RsbU (regulator of sigma subunit)
VLGFLRYNTGTDPGDGGQGVILRGAWLMFTSVGLLVLLVILEVADRLSLKDDLEVARGIQLAMLPASAVELPGLEVFGMSRPANTVGGDLYDVRVLPSGRLVVAVGDVAGKGSPAALLMALFLAMLRVILDEDADLVALTMRLNGQIVRQAPGTRFITLFIASFDPVTGQLDYVNAGHPPGLVRRTNGRFDRLQEGGMALGLFEGSTYTLGSTTLEPGELLVSYSDGITEAEHPTRGYFDEDGLQRAITDARALPAEDLCRSVFGAVRRHTDEGKLGDDLTILALRRPMSGGSAAAAPG